MNLKEIGEFGFIRKISRGCLIRPQHIIKAIGDDAAAFNVAAGEVILVTTDLLVERIHFLRDATTGFDLGFKSLAVNLSDIAAMGGTAREAFISIAVPKDCPVEYLYDLYEGIKSLATEYEVNLLGGDTTRSTDDLIINIAVVGSIPENEILTRDSAQKGDLIYSTGYLGDSRAGLHLILNDIEADSVELKTLFKAHILPKPNLHEGRFLATRKGVHAAIDVSDGLSSDLGHIVEESRVGARIYADKIPVSPELKYFCSRFDFDPVDYALSGGEDYKLLVTVAAQDATGVEADYIKKFDQPIYPIGEITDTKRMEISYPDGETKPIILTGWDHFKAGKE